MKKIYLIAILFGCYLYSCAENNDNSNIIGDIAFAKLNVKEKINVSALPTGMYLLKNEGVINKFFKQ